MSNYIVEFLRDNKHIGAPSGIKAAGILAAMGRNTSEDSQRRLKAEVQHFRSDWHAEEGIDNYILSNTENGYYLSSNDNEAVRFFATQNSRAIQSFTTVKELRRYLKSKGCLRKGA